MSESEPLKRHPLSSLWPPLRESELLALRGSMHERGFDPASPIVLHEGMVLDGWHRCEAAVTAGVEPVFREYDGRDPAGYVIAAHIGRRHMTPAERAYAVARCREWKAPGRPESSSHDEDSPPAATTRQTMAAEAGVSTATIDRAKARIRKERGEPVPGRPGRGHRAADDFAPDPEPDYEGESQDPGDWSGDAAGPEDDGGPPAPAYEDEDARPFDERAAAMADAAGPPEPPDPDAAPKVVHVSQATGEIEWYTPPDIIVRVREAFGGRIDLDPATSTGAQENLVKAAHYLTAEQDALDPATLWMPDDEGVLWGGNVFINPPYRTGLVMRFASRLLDELNAGNIGRAIWLSNNSTDAKWADKLLRAASAVCFPTGRIRFLNADMQPEQAPLQGQMLLAFDSQTDNGFAEHHGDFTDRFDEAFRSLGRVWR